MDSIEVEYKNVQLIFLKLNLMKMIYLPKIGVFWLFGSETDESFAMFCCVDIAVRFDFLLVFLGFSLFLGLKLRILNQIEA